MELPKNAITWFEIPVIGFERAKKFYSAIYDYDMPEFPADNRMGILLYNADGGIGGAIVQGVDYVPSKNGHKIYLQAGDDLTIVLNRVKDAGGKILMPKTLITEQLGYEARVEDTEGNIIYLHSRN